MAVAPVCCDRTAEFQRLAGAHGDALARKRAAWLRPVERWLAAERSGATDHQVPLAQLRRAAHSALRRAARTEARNVEHAEHLALALEHALRIGCDREARCARQPTEPRRAGSPDAEQARARVVAQLRAPPEYYGERAAAVRRVGRQLVRTSGLVAQLGQLVGEQHALVERFAVNVERAEARIDAAHDELRDAAPRAYHTWRWRARTYCVPHSLTARLRLCFVALIALNVALVVLEIL
jgi:hypothetical protein